MLDLTQQIETLHACSKGAPATWMSQHSSKKWFCRNAVRQSLQRLRLQLADVTPVVRGRPMPGWTPSRLNTRYQPALHLAELILAGGLPRATVGKVQVSGFVFDMWKIYEDFVCVALAAARLASASDCRRGWAVPRPVISWRPCRSMGPSLSSEDGGTRRACTGPGDAPSQWWSTDGNTVSGDVAPK